MACSARAISFTTIVVGVLLGLLLLMGLRGGVADDFPLSGALDSVPLNGITAGTLVLHTTDATYLATVVYVRGSNESEVFDLLSAYDSREEIPYEVSENVTYAVACLQNCPPRDATRGDDGIVRLQANLSSRLRELGAAYGVKSLAESEARVGLQDGTFFAITFVRAPTPLEADPALLKNVSGRMESLLDELAESCIEPLCDLQKAPLSVEAWWDRSWWSFDDMRREPRTHVVGALRWKQGDPALDAPAADLPVANVDLVPTRSYLFLPTAAMGAAAVGFLACLTYNPVARLLGAKDRPLPMPLVGAILACASLAFVHFGISTGPSAFWFVAIAFLFVLIAITAWYLHDPLGPIDVSGSAYGAFAAIAPAAYFAWRFDLGALVHPVGLLSLVYEGRLDAEVRAAVRESLALFLWLVIVGFATLLILALVGRRRARRMLQKAGRDPPRWAELSPKDVSLGPEEDDLGSAYILLRLARNERGGHVRRVWSSIRRRLSQSWSTLREWCREQKVDAAAAEGAQQAIKSEDSPPPGKPSVMEQYFQRRRSLR